MLLRVSGERTGTKVDVTAVMGGAAESGVAHGELLREFTEAAVARDEAALSNTRERIRLELGPEALVDAAAVVANFQRMVRIADATGIPLDAGFEVVTRELRDELGVARFASSTNTPSPPVE